MVITNLLWELITASASFHKLLFREMFVKSSRTEKESALNLV